MSTAPAELSAERMDALLSRVAEACMEGVEEAREQMRGAEDAAAFERASRSFNGLCRNIRQTIAMKQRLDHERVALVVAKDRCADAAEERADKAHAKALREHRRRATAAFNRVRWDEYEPDEEVDDLDTLIRHAFLGSLTTYADEDEFLDTPVDALVKRFVGEVTYKAEAEPARDEPPRAAPPARASKPSAKPAQRPAPKPPAAAAPEPPPPEPPAAPPPVPEPEPYIPPWERRPRGAIFRGGGSGW